jgi:YegS/Rv2252/BmrU family lipid kinase
MTEKLPPSTTALVINTRSRKAEKFFFSVLDLFIAQEVDVNLFPVRNPAQLSAAVATAIRQGNKRIIIGGGDGTISAMTKHFVGNDIELGILPLGTANSFIKSLGISSNVTEAIDTAINGKVIKIDIGKCNDIYFANASSFGFTTLVAENISDNVKKHLGTLAYALEGLKQALGMKQFEVEHGAKKDILSTYQVIVANGSFYGPSKLARAATVNNGKLVLLAMNDLERFQLLRVWIASIFGKSIGQNTNYELVTESFTLTAKPNHSVSIDGELYKAPKLAFSIVPDSVHVLVPHEFKPKTRM